MMMQNFLKGESIDENQFIYLRDEIGDSCLFLKLRDRDHVFPRIE